MKNSLYGVEKEGRSTVVVCDKGGEVLELSCDKVLVAVGRKAYTDGLSMTKLVFQRSAAVKFQ